MKKIIYLFLLIILTTTSGLRADYIWPIQRPKRLSGTFCEYRRIKFHHGIDVGCSGIKGYNIYAAEKGHVITVMYQQFGIGFALVLKHPDGKTTLYGHLDRFSPIILRSRRVRAVYDRILNRKNFRIDFKSPEIPVSRGAVIGYSGESGVGIEHFHFELRDRDDALLNPLLNGINIIDNDYPVIQRVFFVPLDGYSHVNGLSEPIAYNVKLVETGEKKLYSLEADKTPILGGRIGVKVSVFDRTGNSNRCGIYKISSFLDGRMHYSFAFDRVPKEQTYRMGLYYDYDNSSMSRFTYYLYFKPDEKGILEYDTDGKQIKMKILCSDAHGNTSALEFPFQTSRALKESHYKVKHNLKPGRELELVSDDKTFCISFERNAALYKEMVQLEKREPYEFRGTGLTSKSDIYYISPTNLCLDKPAEITLRYAGSDYRKIAVFVRNGYNSVRYLGRGYDSRKQQFQVTSRRMGEFFLVRDDVPPKIKFRSRKRVRRNRPIAIRVSDRGTGLDLESVHLTVDGRQVAWDYNFDKGYIEILAHNKIWNRGSHVIHIRLQDKAGNKTPMLRLTYKV